MLMIKQDLAYLHIHAGIVMTKDEDSGIVWRCLYTKTYIKFTTQFIRVDYGTFIKRMEIDRPYCPACNPAAEYDSTKFTEVPKPIKYTNLVSVHD